MDERLEEALKFAEYRTTLNNQLAQLKHRTDTELLHSVNGGTFTITIELINFTKFLINSDEKEIVILDYNGSPILIDDIKLFHDTIFNKYKAVTKTMYDEFTEIRKKRTVKSILDIELGE